MAGDDLPVPTEIPWQLLATCMTVDPPSDVDNGSLSIFTYVPQLKSLEGDYPDDRLVYLKFSVSVSPISLAWLGAAGSGGAFDLLGAHDLPVWRMILDVAITVPEAKKQSVKPYFLSAAPIRRTMLETGIVGQQVFEGESNGLAVGKSGAEMHESGHTTTDHSSTSKGIGIAGLFPPFLLGAGLSHTSTGTTVDSNRDVTQVMDSTQRNASDERRELFSHLTHVNNVLSLLRTNLVGTPFLRFDLVPRPLRPLTVDPSDPNLWYAELLNRRSSGIEGMQDFYAIAVVPRDAPVFCVKADLRRIFIVEPKLPASDFEAPYDYSPAGTARLFNYLYRRYPKGTPLDDLDVQPGLENRMRPAMPPGVEAPYTGPPFEKQRWVVSEWTVGSSGIYVYVEATQPVYPIEEPARLLLLYKEKKEVYLEMIREAYEAELAKSPLERGSLFSLPLSLEACQVIGHLNLPVPPPSSLFVTAAELIGSLSIIDFTSNVPLAPMTQSFSPVRDRYRAAMMSWNALGGQFASQLSLLRPEKLKKFRFDDPRVLDLLLSNAAYLGRNDPANRSLDEVAGLFGLSPEQIDALKATGVKDLSALAAAVKFAPIAESRAREREDAPQRMAPPQPSAEGCNFFQRFWLWLSGRKPPRPAPEPTPAPEPIPVTTARASELRAALGAALQARFEESHKQKL